MRRITHLHGPAHLKRLVSGNNFPNQLTILGRVLQSFPSKLPPKKSVFFMLHAFNHSSLWGRSCFNSLYKVLTEPINKCNLGGENDFNNKCTVLKITWCYWRMYDITIQLCIFFISLSFKVIPEQQVQVCRCSLLALSSQFAFLDITPVARMATTMWHHT